MRIGVLGLGGVGSAAARFLAEAGHDVVGLEQFCLDHDRGSSYGGSRVIRRVYPDPLYARLMDAAYPLWEALAVASGERLFLRCGGFFFGPEGHPEMRATEAALGEVGVPFQRWSASETKRRLPPFRLSGDEYGIFEPDSGLLRPSRCVVANARGARAAGAELREGVRVEAIDATAGALRLTAGGETIEIDRLVVTAGPWTAPLLAPWVSLPFTVTSQQYSHFAVLGDRAAFHPDRFPVWIDMAEYYYGFPEHDEITGVKVALHEPPGPRLDPDNPEREARPEENETLRRYLSRRLPDAAGAVTYSKICLYTLSPDHDFVVDRLPGETRIVFIGGLSGHGFKFSVLLGRIAAQLALDKDPGYDLSRFSISRFQE